MINYSWYEHFCNLGVQNKQARFTYQNTIVIFSFRQGIYVNI